MRAIPMPADFADVAIGKSNDELSAHYGVSHGLVGRWRKAANRPAACRVGVPMPENFAKIAPDFTYKEMEDRWHVGSDAITRWCREAGVASSGVSRRAAKVARESKPKPIRKAQPPRFWRSPTSPASAADVTDAGQAATYLRRFYPNVYRATVLDKAERRAKGIPGDGRDYFCIGGRGVMPANDMVALARSKGFAA